VKVRCGKSLRWSAGIATPKKIWKVNSGKFCNNPHSYRTASIYHNFWIGYSVLFFYLLGGCYRKINNVVFSFGCYCSWLPAVQIVNEYLTAIGNSGYTSGTVPKHIDCCVGSPTVPLVHPESLPENFPVFFSIKKWTHCKLWSFTGLKYPEIRLCSNSPCSNHTWPLKLPKEIGMFCMVSVHVPSFIPILLGQLKVSGSSPSPLNAQPRCCMCGLRLR